MKCIVRIYGLRGGAPRSILQHIKVLKQFSYDDIECMAHNSDDQLRLEFEKTVSKMIQRKSPEELYWARKKNSALKEYLWEYRYIKQNKPDLVIALGQINGALYSDLCKKLGIPLINYIPGGDIQQDDLCFDFFHNCEIICFSLENEEVIRKHFPESHINVISNRINVCIRFQDFIEHYSMPQRKVNVLIVSRLDEGKIESIYSVLNILSRCITNDLQINVRIAGGGKCQEELSSFCNTLQTKNLQIDLLGHIHDLTEQYKWAHVVAGKGRSVIEPIMMNRIGCIIGENDKIEFCRMDNFENLYHYNFSGRNLRNKDSYTEMNDMLHKIKNGQISDSFVLGNAENAIQRYAVDFLPDKLKRVLDKLPQTVKPDYRVSILFSYLRFVAGQLFSSLKYHFLQKGRAT